uniref:Uncharacterized protein n=1 Tax=Meloidogyne javanica TaxID=6303 RepID=A0A915MEB6_MELJA
MVIVGKMLANTKLLNDWKAIQTISAMVLCEYLSQNSGPLWKAIRGGGYAYSVYLSVLPDKSLVQLEINCSNLTAAYRITSEIVSVLSGNLDDTLFNGAVSILVKKLLDEQKTSRLAAISSLLGIIRTNNANFIRDLCVFIMKLTRAEVLKQGKENVLNLFNPKETVTSIGIDENKKEEAKNLFKNIKFPDLDKLQII